MPFLLSTNYLLVNCAHKAFSNELHPALNTPLLQILSLLPFTLHYINLNMFILVLKVSLRLL